MTKKKSLKSKKIAKKWYLIDAQDRILGRIATFAARILRGKNNPAFVPYLDCGDYLVIINAQHVKVTGNKLKDKMYKHYSGYPSGLKEKSLEVMLKSKPEEVLKHAIKGMLPRGPLGRDIFRKLNVYAGSEHKHNAQAPKTLEVK